MNLQCTSKHVLVPCGAFLDNRPCSGSWSWTRPMWVGGLSGTITANILASMTIYEFGHDLAAWLKRLGDKYTCTFLKKLFNLFESLRDIAPIFWVSPPNAPASQGFAKPKPGTRDSPWISCVGSRDPTSCLPGVCIRKLAPDPDPDPAAWESVPSRSLSGSGDT